MTQTGDIETKADGLKFEYELDAPLAKVWRALTVPEFIERWLLPVEPKTRTDAPSPPSARISLRLIEAEDLKFVRYSWREPGIPVLDNTVTFELAPNTAGGTTFRILHEMAPSRLNAANSNIPSGTQVMRLAA
jgi:uncharacterized protein YndB with AHSA1/START domain